MDKKFKIGVIVTAVVMVFVIFIAFNQNKKEEKATALDSTAPAYLDYETDKSDNEDTQDDIEETYQDEDSEDYDVESENDVVQYQSESDKLESRLEDIANEVIADAVTSDYKVTYQFEPDDNTGYIFLTWLGANNTSKDDVNTMLQASGFKDVMQEIANSTAEELQEVANVSADVKPIRGCIILRDMSNKTLYSCYNE